MLKVNMQLLENNIKYKSGYKYQLHSEASLKIDLEFIKPIDFYHITYSDGILTVRKGYAWDGPSGPTIDTKNFMRGSLFHDALYQLIREGYLDKKYRELADVVLYNINKIDGMSSIRNRYVYESVRLFGSIANKSVRLDPYTAP